MTRAGLVAVLGRPNVGKSTLVNALTRAKVSITAASPNTTRRAVRGVLTEGGVQMVFVDTPGLHRAQTTLGHRLNEVARHAVSDVDAVIAVIEAPQVLGPGDRATLGLLVRATAAAPDLAPVVVVNKTDRAGRATVAEQLLAACRVVEELAAAAGVAEAAQRVEYFATAARTGGGVDALRDHLRAAMPESPYLFDADEVSDVESAEWVAELVREQVVWRAREELPHAVHCRVTEITERRARVEIVVERPSQRAIVLGRGGQNLRAIGTAARQQLPAGMYLELRVVVERDWQRRDDVLDRFGY